MLFSWDLGFKKPNSLLLTHSFDQFLQVLTCFMVTFCGQLSCTASTPVFLTCGHYQLNSSPEKNLSLAGIPTHDLLGTKPICYQLIYPGLDLKKSILQICTILYTFSIYLQCFPFLVHVKAFHMLISMCLRSLNSKQTNNNKEKLACA